jgi:hypothetical protein
MGLILFPTQVGKLVSNTKNNLMKQLNKLTTLLLYIVITIIAAYIGLQLSEWANISGVYLY